ncbi:MAG: polysaccharide lyase 6 family protein [bacterium]
MRHKLFLLIRIAFLSLLVPLSKLASTEYRVSTAAQIASTMTAAKPGDTLTMTNGQWMNSAIVFQGKGTAELPILLRAESYGRVILSGTSTLRISGRHLVIDGLLFKNGYSPSGAVIEFRSGAVESDSCRLTNSAIIDYNPSSSSIDYKWVSLYGSYNRVDHCYLKGKTHSGATLVVWRLTAKPNYHRIDSNYFAFRPLLFFNGTTQNGGETIRIGTSDSSLYDSFTTVEYELYPKNWTTC